MHVFYDSQRNKCIVSKHIIAHTHIFACSRTTAPCRKCYKAKHQCSKQACTFTRRPKPIIELHGKHK